MGWRPHSIVRRDSDTSSGRLHSSVHARSRHRGERVELRQRHAARLQRAEAIDELGEDRLVDLFLAREGAVACAQDLIFEAFELFRDEALGRFDGLPADVVLWHTLGVLAGDLDEEAGDTVVAELQSGDTGSFALTAFQLEEKFIGVRCDRAKLIEVRVVTCRDDIAVADEGRWFLCNSGGQKLDDVSVLFDAGTHFL